LLRTHLRGTCEHLLLLVFPANRPAPWRWTSSLGRPGGERGAPSLCACAAAAQVSRRPSCEPRTANAQPSPPRQARFGQRRPSRSPTTATRRTRCAQTWAAPPHRRMPGSSAVRTARTPRPRTPEACPSGHPDRAGRVDTGRVDTRRPPDHWTDVRPADSGRGQGDEWRVRRPGISTVTATATAGWAGPTPARVAASAALRPSAQPRLRCQAHRPGQPPQGDPAVREASPGQGALPAHPRRPGPTPPELT
jgi:hypothetical protein